LTGGCPTGKVSQLTGGCPTGKAHFTETCEPDRPHLIRHVATTDAATADLDTVPDRHRNLAASNLLPDTTWLTRAMSASGRSFLRPTTMA
jgi:hypothetical protein